MDRWQERTDLVRELTELSRGVVKCAEALKKGAEEGSHSAFDKALEKLREVLDQAGALMAAVDRASFRTDPQELLDEFETLARAEFTDHNVVRIGSLVAIGNVVVRVPAGAPGDVKATVGATEIRTSSVAVLLKAVREELRADFDGKRFARTLVDAIQLHTSLRGENSTGSCGLEDLRRMISLNRDGRTNYGPQMFTHDLQSLATVGLSAMREAGLELSEAAAARVKFEVVTERGTLIQYGAIKHLPPEKRQA